jgi:hypothetical protein
MQITVQELKVIRSQQNGEMIKLKNAITDAMREIQKCPEDSMQDIFNEKLEIWETGLWMDHNFVISFC